MATHGLGPTRAKVLEALQKSHVPMTATDVAEVLDLHPNSARHHLGELFAAGYAVRTTLPPHGTGRPRVGFSPTAQAPAVTNEHLVRLTSAVLQHFFTDDVSEAEAVGRSQAQTWGAPKPLPEVLSYFETAGFGPQITDDELQFTRCPYRALLDPEAMPAVCQVHLGFLQTALAEHAIGTVTISPEICRAQVSGLSEHEEAAAQYRAPETRP